MRIFHLLLLAIILSAFLALISLPDTVECKSVSSGSGSGSKGSASASSHASGQRKQQEIEDDEEEEDEESGDDEDEEDEAEADDDDDGDSDEFEVDENSGPRTFPWSNTPITTEIWEKVSRNDVNGLRALLNRDSQLVNERSLDGRGMLFWAFEYDRREIIDLAMEFGADPEALDSEGNKPADLAKDKEL